MLLRAEREEQRRLWCRGFASGRGRLSDGVRRVEMVRRRREVGMVGKRCIVLRLWLCV